MPLNPFASGGEVTLTYLTQDSSFMGPPCYDYLGGIALWMTTLASTRVIPDAIVGAQVARTGKAVNHLWVYLETGFGSVLPGLVGTILRGTECRNLKLDAQNSLAKG